MFMPAVVVLDTLRMVCLGRNEETALRKLVEKARVTARIAINAPKALVVKRDADAGGDCCCGIVSDIERNKSHKLEVPRTLYSNQ
jgi:hypothetical protein